MRFPVPTKVEWFVIAVVLIVIIAILHPAPHYRKTRLESCHLCGNCRRIAHSFRWWQLSSVTTEPVEIFSVNENHEHDWWRYSSYFTSYSRKEAGGKTYRYRDGRNVWTASPVK